MHLILRFRIFTTLSLSTLFILRALAYIPPQKLLNYSRTNLQSTTGRSSGSSRGVPGRHSWMSHSGFEPPGLFGAQVPQGTTKDRVCQRIRWRTDQIWPELSLHQQRCSRLLQRHWSVRLELLLHVVQETSDGEKKAVRIPRKGRL